MAYQYKFHKADGTEVPLNDIDRELCERTHYPYSDRNYCQMFVEMTQWLGLSILTKCGNGASRITPEMFDAYRTQFGDTYDFTDDGWDIAREFLAVRYQLEMWYSR